jgi:lipopolysaccharide/colanic/teichoic acid biosynthesis glycosyltransferase
MTMAPAMRARASRIVRSPAKRAFDVLFASAGLIVTSPIWLIVPLAIKLEDRGPVFYAQPRSGLGARPFRAWKIRSMVIDADRAGALQAVARDPRVTRVGRLLRATAMDELPQLWNVLRGDMSVVGPRALRPGEIEAASAGRLAPEGALISEPLEEVPGFETRSAVRPGLTGLAQVYARRDLPRRQKFRYDRLYICRQSLRLDAWLVLQSLVITILGSWERRGIR